MNTLQGHYRPLGSTGLHVSPLGLGTVKLGRNQGVKYPTRFQLPSDQQARELIAHAREVGINLIDTAPAYGISESRLGPLLAGQREHWVICTKVGEEFDNGISHFDFSGEHTRRSVERSLKRLQTDFLDLVLVHSDGNDLAVLEQGALDMLATLKREGLIRAFGFSGKSIDGGVAALERSDCAMVTYNLREQAERPVLDFALAQRKGILIKKALASGHLCVDGSDPVQAGLQLVLEHPAVSSAIVGTINRDHLDHNVAAALAALGN